MAKDDPKMELTRFITRGTDKIDRVTEFPTGAAVRLQLFDRTLDEEFDLDIYGNAANRRADAMWSYKRKSREEAVDGMKSAKEVEPVFDFSDEEVKKEE